MISWRLRECARTVDGNNTNICYYFTHRESSIASKRKLCRGWGLHLSVHWGAGKNLLSPQYSPMPVQQVQQSKPASFMRYVCLEAMLLYQTQQSPVISLLRNRHTSPSTEKRASFFTCYVCSCCMLLY